MDIQCNWGASFTKPEVSRKEEIPKGQGGLKRVERKAQERMLG